MTRPRDGTRAAKPCTDTRQNLVCLDIGQAAEAAALAELRERIEADLADRAAIADARPYALRVAAIGRAIAAAVPPPRADGSAAQRKRRGGPC